MGGYAVDVTTMAAPSGTNTISIRLPADICHSSRELAKRRGISLSALVQESLKAAVDEEEDQRFYDSFTLLGQDMEMSDVEYALPAQREVMLGGDSQE
ncbi:MAG: hypothetical protein HY321_18380 [Armatimonadetes bacterium]|nr:hypothetical protein [Armatimonadota bacterium]